jgi:hypothetical protein
MRGLFASARVGRQVLTTELIRERIRALCGEDVEPDIQLYIRRGDTLVFKGDELGPCFELEHITAGTDEESGGEVRVPQYGLRPGVSYSQPDCLGWFR